LSWAVTRGVGLGWAGVVLELGGAGVVLELGWCGAGAGRGWCVVLEQGGAGVWSGMWCWDRKLSLHILNLAKLSKHTKIYTTTTTLLLLFEFYC